MMRPMTTKLLLSMDAFGSDLDGRASGGQVGYFADFFQIDVGADEDGVAEFAGGLDGARPAERHRSAAVGAVRGG